MKREDAMRKHESIAIATVNVFEEGDFFFMANLKQARHIFASTPSKPLKLAVASLCGLFRIICQKSDTRRMDEDGLTLVEKKDRSPRGWQPVRSEVNTRGEGDLPN